ncbi:DUF6461 domain-containing protein [Actinomadura sp. WAC 06369]|uniref:DUF6461 domain-containing protein n=1 Tax=Actinomadura sp. WAC 06369 TaxID=2203193 RepID=UPI000F7AF763|nr:DUF6461 domain-containing protein [Actinomadura sp. WAC 06369]RSN53379.1 hypothetical protein DMH08_27570 [Actinomadura sp. WAC 06369]
MTDPLAPFRWLDAPEDGLDEVFCVALFPGLTPSEVLHRFAPGEAGREVAFAELWDVGDEPALEAEGGQVGVVQASGGSAAVEIGGRTAVLPECSARLSRGCELVAVARHDHAEDRFVYAVDGEVVCGFVPPLPKDGWGSDPHRIDAALRGLGIPTDPGGDRRAEFARLHPDKLPRTFALAAELTGVPFTRELTAFPFLTAPITVR